MVELTQAQNRVNNRIQKLLEQANLKLIRAWLCLTERIICLHRGVTMTLFFCLAKP